MKQGFSLIELILALFIASFISLSLFQLLSTTRRSVRRIANVVEVDVPLMSFFSQVEKDITGMFTPRNARAAYAKKGRDSLPQVFVLEGKNESLFLSFITTGGVALLDKDGGLVALPAVRRVAYTLEKDPQRPQVMRLMYRFSDKELSGEALKKPTFAPSYELVSGIKNIEIECTLFERAEKKGDGKKSKMAQNDEPQKKSTTTIIKEWNEEEIWEKYASLIPAYVRLKGTIQDRIGT